LYCVLITSHADGAKNNQRSENNYDDTKIKTTMVVYNYLLCV